MACNTAHLLLPKLEEAVQHKIDSLIDISVEEVKRRKVFKVGVLASPTTVKTRLFTKPLEEIGVEVVLPSDDEQETLELLIRQVIAGKCIADLRKSLKQIITRLLNEGSQAVIIGCTELSVIAKDFRSTDLIDPLSLAAKQLTNRI